MCLIAVATDSRYLVDKDLELALRGNMDGFGFMGLIQDSLFAERYAGVAGQAQFDDYSALFRERLAYWKSAAQGQIAVHLRQRTSGPCDAATAHPFPLKTDYFDGYLMHNGVYRISHLRQMMSQLNVDVVPDKRDSDTGILVKILEKANLPPKEQQDFLLAGIRENPFNRLVLWTRGESRPLIYNMDAGMVLDSSRLWYSNDWYFH
ncbi:hypothetical protein ACJU26_09785 [Acidithiobacillus sp. M4-SHS-6]|uniref:hypothetical protein n=1 Tax=Acidithiobacillus sp. M4-SHS-6 TaxID=3383024 RepID=UPI0039BDB493